MNRIAIELAGAARLRDRLLQPILEQDPVGQVRQRIVVREVPDPCLGLQAFGDVAFDRDVVGDHALGVAHRRDRGFLLVERAVLAPAGQRAVPHLTARDGVLHGAVMRLVIPIAHEQRERRLAERVGATVPGDPLERRVDVLESARPHR